MTFAHEIALRKAVRDRLLANAALVARLGGQRIHDQAPRGAPTPYVVVAQSQVRDWSTMTERGGEHLLFLDVWSQPPGAREALEIMALIADALNDAQLTLPGATCVLVRVLDTQTTREVGGRFARGRLRVRALVEPV